MSRKPEFDLFVDIYKLALEFSKSNIHIFNELSHYLIDNLISKICIFLALENGLPYSTISSKGKKKTYDFPRLYKDILSKLYHNIPDYDKEIQSLHDLRNIFQHGSESIRMGIRPQYVIEYVRLAEKILKEIRAIDQSETIESSNFIKEQFLKIKPIKKSSTEVEKNLILIELSELEKEFDEKLVAEKVKSDLDMRIIIYPLKNKGELFGRGQFSELIEYLEKEAMYGPYLDSSDRTLIFGDLKVSRDGLLSISKYPMIGSIIIYRNGLIIYNWSYGEKEDPNRETLPTYYMSAYLLGLFNFFNKFYTKVNYLEDVELFFKIRNIPNWEYSPHQRFVFNRRKYPFLNKDFNPFRKVFNIKEFSSKEGIHNIVLEIFNEILLSYGISSDFKLPDDLKDYE